MSGRGGCPAASPSLTDSPPTHAQREPSTASPPPCVKRFEYRWWLEHLSAPCKTSRAHTDHHRPSSSPHQQMTPVRARYLADSTASAGTGIAPHRSGARFFASRRRLAIRGKRRPRNQCAHTVPDRVCAPLRGLPDIGRGPRVRLCSPAAPDGGNTTQCDCSPRGGNLAVTPLRRRAIGHVPRSRASVAIGTDDIDKSG